MKIISLTLALLVCCGSASGAAAKIDHRLYVAVPGIRDSADYGGTGILVFDIDHDHRFVRRIAVPALGDRSHPMAAKGICASAVTGRLYVSTPQTLSCLDLQTEKVLWKKSLDAGCDRMATTPDGKTLFEPTLEGQYWHVIDAKDGREIGRITTGSGAHNTIVAADGKHVFLAGLHSPVLLVADVKTRAIDQKVGPFADAIRPFTVNGRSTRCYVCVNGLLGFEMGDLTTGKMLCRVAVQGFAIGPTKRHGCPSHGIGLTPDETEIWVTDAHNRRLHVFDNTVMPPALLASVELRDEPGWVTFGIDGRYAYPSTGEVIDVKTRKTVTQLRDERGADVQSEKLLEIDFDGEKPVRAGDQFGVGRVTAGR